MHFFSSQLHCATLKILPPSRLKTTSRSSTTHPELRRPLYANSHRASAGRHLWTLPFIENSTQKCVEFSICNFFRHIFLNQSGHFFCSPTGSLQRQSLQSAKVCKGPGLWSSSPSSDAGDNARAVDAPQPACERRSVGGGRSLPCRVQVHRVEEPNHLLRRDRYSAKVPSEHGDAVSRC